MAPDPERLIPFILAVLLIELTPGPNMGYLAIVAGRSGRLAGMATVAGVTLGLAFYMLLSVFGVAEAILQVPWLYDLLRWAGVAYLLWLAWDTWRDETPTAPGEDIDAPGLLRLAGRGMMANILNPKALVFYVALLPGFSDPARPLPPQALGLGLIHLVIALVIHTAIVVLAARAIPLLAADHPERRHRLRAAFALALAAIALWLAWQTRR